MLVVEDNEDATEVARSLLSPHDTAILLHVRMEPGCQWPTATYKGSRYALAAIAAKANGSQVGRPTI